MITAVRWGAAPLVIAMILSWGESTGRGQVVEIDQDTTIDAANSLPSNAILVRDGPESATQVELVTGGELSTAEFGSSRVTEESTLVITGGQYGGEISVEEGAHLAVRGGQYVLTPDAPIDGRTKAAIRLEREASLNMTGGELDVTWLFRGGIRADGETSVRISGGNVLTWVGQAVTLHEKAELIFSGGELTSWEFSAVLANDFTSVDISGGTIHGGENDAALELTDHAYAIVTGGQMITSEGNAVYARGNSSAWIENAEMHGSDGPAVIGVDRACLTVLNSQIGNHDGDGLLALGETRARVVDSQVFGGDDQSVSAADASHVILVGVDMGWQDSLVLGVGDDALVDLWDSSAFSDDGAPVWVGGNGTLNIRSAALANTDLRDPTTLFINGNGTIRIFGTQIEHVGNRVQGVFRDGLEFDWTYELASPGAQLELIDLLTADYNSDGALTAQDVDSLGEAIRAGSNDPAFDLDESGQVDRQDLDLLVDDYLGTTAGDTNLDVRFDSSDLVTAFQAGRYETGLSAGWNSGDWNQDGLFDSGDMVTAFQAGSYLGSRARAVRAVPEPSCMGLLGVGISSFWWVRRRSCL